MTWKVHPHTGCAARVHWLASEAAGREQGAARRVGASQRHVPGRAAAEHEHEDDSEEYMSTAREAEHASCRGVVRAAGQGRLRAGRPGARH